MNNQNFLRRPLPYAQYHAVWWIIGINVAIFIISLNDYAFMALMGQKPITWDMFAQILANPSPVASMVLIPSEALSGSFWQFLGYGFLHSPDGFTHILFNMIALAIFAPNIERRMGSNEFLLFYLLSIIFVGIASAFGYMLMGQDVFMIGASGGVYAVLLLWATFFPTGRIFIWGIIPLRAPIMVLVYTGLSVFGLLGGGSGISHIGHLMGFVFAFLYALVRLGVNPIKVFIESSRR